MNPANPPTLRTETTFRADSTRSRIPQTACGKRGVGRLMRPVAMGVTFALLSAVPVIAQPDAVRPTANRALPPGVQVHRDLEYIPDGHERHRLDLYLPEQAARPLPVIVWVHGGGWQRGDKSNCPVIWFATNGYAVAAINYRFSSHAIFPAQIHDCKAAVRWLRANAGKYRLDPEHIGAGGGSAGGHLVALLGTTPDVKEFEGPGGHAGQSSRVQAVLDWFGPTDFLTVGPKETRTRLLGGDAQQNQEKAIKASPMTYVSKNVAPFLIMHGDGDKTVPLAQSEVFAEALQKAGAEATLLVVKGAGHGGAKFTSPENLKQIEAFFAKHLKPSKPASPQATVSRPLGARNEEAAQTDRP